MCIAAEVVIMQCNLKIKKILIVILIEVTKCEVYFMCALYIGYVF